MWFYIMIVTLLIALMWITRVREDFVNVPPGILPADMPALKDIPDPRELFGRMRGLLEKYDKPEVWGGIIQRMDKDPGQLARMNLGIEN
jgi:hypothetical protein